MAVVCVQKVRLKVNVSSIYQPVSIWFSTWYLMLHQSFLKVSSYLDLDYRLTDHLTF